MTAVQTTRSVAAESPTYTTHAGDVTRDRDEILTVWEDHFGPLDMQPAKFDHFYRENPNGRALIRLLRHAATGELAGVIGAGPRPLIWRGRPIRGAVVAHFAVAARHRSLGPALMLQHSLIDAARGQFDLLYGLPRPSAVGVSRRAGFSTLGTLVRHAKVLRHGDYLRRRLPGFVATPAGALVDMATRVRDGFAGGLSSRRRWRWVQESDARMDALWQGSTKNNALTSVRDRALLRWRFDTPPVGRARYLLVSGKDGGLQAWFACEELESPGGPMTVMDYWSADAMIGIGRPLIRALIAAANEQGCSAVHLMLTASDPAMAGWHAEGFAARSEQPIIGLWLDHRQAPKGVPPLHLTLVDQDG